MNIYTINVSVIYAASNLSIIYQLINEVEYLMKNYGDRGGCYPSRP